MKNKKNVMFENKIADNIAMCTGWLLESPNMMGPPIVGDVVLRNVWRKDGIKKYNEIRKRKEEGNKNV